MNNEHTAHDSSVKPVAGCKECDKEINRPIPKCFGNGKSSNVISPTKEEDVRREE